MIIHSKEFVRQNYKTMKAVSARWLKTNYEDFSVEPQYANIKHKLLIERLRDNSYRKDIQVFCFNGKAKYIELLFAKDNNYYSQIYDVDWNLTEYTYMPNICREAQTKPNRLEEIIQYAEVLSKEFSFVRVDFAFDGDDIHVVEMTFTPCSAMIPFHKEEFDLELGNQLILPKEACCNAG